MTPAARLARLLPADPRPDGALLAAFLTDRDEAAFAELVRRHGPLVLAACRRLLPDPADVDDAFQAAFLVLVRRARRLTGAAALGPWLYRVAAWTARNVRHRNARRLARTAPLADTPAPPASPVPALDLDTALLALPEKYRAALVLCHLQGWSRRDAAERLGCPEGTLSSLLARGLTKLKARLPGYESAPAVAVVPAALASATVSAVRATELASPAVAELAAGVLRAVWVPKATAAGVAVVFALGAGVGLSVREAPAVAQAPTAPAPREKAAEAGRDFEAEIRAAAARLQAAEDGLRISREQLRRTEAKLAKGTATAADVERVQANVSQFRQAAERFRSAIAAAQDDRERLAFVAGDGADVGGTLAVDVRFPDADRYRVAAAVRALVEEATDVTDGAPADAQLVALRGSHVRVQYPWPQRFVRVAGGPRITLDVAVVALPLTRSPGGYVLVRDGDRVVRFSKYPHAAAARFQEAIGAAVPAAP